MCIRDRRMHMRIHVRILVRIHMHIHTHIHTHIRIRTAGLVLYGHEGCAETRLVREAIYRAPMRWHGTSA